MHGRGKPQSTSSNRQRSREASRARLQKGAAGLKSAEGKGKYFSKTLCLTRSTNWPHLLSMSPHSKQKHAKTTKQPAHNSKVVCKCINV
jgi:hypothetical protein